MTKNIILSAEEALIQQARRRAAIENHTLSELFRQWLECHVAQPAASEQYEVLMQRPSHVNAGRKFCREEINERR
jgi:hypothetical protein